MTLPLGLFICVTGVSGSGKTSSSWTRSSRAIKRKKAALGFDAGKHRALSGTAHIDDAVLVDQSPDRPHPALEPR